MVENSAPASRKNMVQRSNPSKRIENARRAREQGFPDASWDRNRAVASWHTKKQKNYEKMQKLKMRKFSLFRRKKHPRSAKHTQNAFKPSQSQDTRLSTRQLVHNAPSSLVQPENRGKSSAP